MTAVATTLSPMSVRAAAAALPAAPPVSELGDAELLHRAAGGRDEGAWRRIVEEHQPRVLRQVLRAGCDQGIAEDISQEVFLKVFRGAAGYRGGQPLAHWIARITTTTAIDALRRRRGESVPLDDVAATLAADEDPAADLDRKEKRRHVREAVMRLPARLREVIWLTTYADMTYEDAAGVLGVPLRTAMSRALAARAQLRRTLAALEAW